MGRYDKNGNLDLKNRAILGFANVVQLDTNNEAPITAYKTTADGLGNVIDTHYLKQLSAIIPNMLADREYHIGESWDGFDEYMILLKFTAPDNVNTTITLLSDVPSDHALYTTDTPIQRYIVSLGDIKLKGENKRFQLNDCMTIGDNAMLHPIYRTSSNKLFLKIKNTEYLSQDVWIIVVYTR